MKKERINEIWGVFFLLLGLFTLGALLSYHPEDISFYTSHPSEPARNWTGLIGAYLAFGLFLAFGQSAFVIPLVLLLWARSFFYQQVPERKMFKFLGLGIALFSLATIVSITVNPEMSLTAGGAAGYVVGKWLHGSLGKLGSYIFAGAALLLSVLLATDFLIFPLVKKIAENLRAVFARKPQKPVKAQKESRGFFSAMKEKKAAKEKQKEKAEIKLPPEFANPTKIKAYQPISPDPNKKTEGGRPEFGKEDSRKPLPSPTVKLARNGKDSSKNETSADDADNSFKGIIGSDATVQRYEFPPTDLLRLPKTEKIEGDDLAANSRAIEGTLKEFGIDVKVVEVEQGPKITLYELLPAPGVRANSISAYEDDLSMALKATSIRLIIPIPGKQTIGVEVPNSVSRPIVIREMIEHPDFRSHRQRLPLLLGKDTAGKPMIADLTTMPHILIAGTTGSGKTVCIKSIIAGFLYYCTPAQLKMVMIDPKMVELAKYNKIAHMLSPVVTDVRKAANTLNWVVQEMERRYRLLAAVGVSNIQSFNERELTEEDKKQVTEAAKDSENVIPASLPYIVVIIDELADLMLVAQDKVETAITRLAQLSRAVGIHLILATQRPSVDVITGVIKANFPARVAFKVASVVDSRTILDNKGADKLLGKGDMLFIQPGSDNMIRGQAPLIMDDETDRIVKFVAQQGQPEYHSEIQAVQNGTANAATGGEKDELFDEAKRIVLTSRTASTSYLQRRLGLGYTRAARIIDQLEHAGVIGPQQGAKPREILMPNPAGDYSEATPVSSEGSEENV
ncbi:MAG TPA: DNA translocase FtsK [Candidatus Omnitrophota bacterium]|nr:DNA translocase FtsK [Candidatus Omnitrophota bacterium]